SPPVCSSQNSALPSLIAAALLMMVPPVRFGTPTDDSGARSPSARATRASMKRSPSASTDSARPARARGWLLQRERVWPVSIERPPCRYLWMVHSNPSTVGNWQEEARAEADSNLRHDGASPEHFSRHSSEVAALTAGRIVKTARRKLSRQHCASGCLSLERRRSGRSLGYRRGGAATGLPGDRVSCWISPMAWNFS